MMLLAVLALALQAATTLPIGTIGRQALPRNGCAAYLWTPQAGQQLLAMAQADPAQLRLSVDGKTRDFARSDQRGIGGFGFATTTEYRGADVTATLEMTVAQRPELTSGASIPEGTLRIDRPGRDSVVLPVAGLIGCVAGQSTR